MSQLEQADETLVRRVCNRLLVQTYLPKMKFTASSNVITKNVDPDFRTLERLSAEVEERLSTVGFQLRMSGVMDKSDHTYAWIESTEEARAERTMMAREEIAVALALRYLYYLGRGNLGRYETCDVTVNDVVKCITETVPVFTTVPNLNTLARVFRCFETRGLVKRPASTSFIALDCQLSIQPTICVYISAEVMDAWEQKYTEIVDELVLEQEEDEADTGVSEQ